MLKQIFRMLSAALVVVLAAPKPGLAQSEAETVRSLLSGRTMMITYRMEARSTAPINKSLFRSVRREATSARAEIRVARLWKTKSAAR